MLKKVNSKKIKGSIIKLLSITETNRCSLFICKQKTEVYNNFPTWLHDENHSNKLFVNKKKYNFGSSHSVHVTTLSREAL